MAASIQAEEDGRFTNNASTSSAAAIPSEEDDNEEEEMILVILFYLDFELLPFISVVGIAYHG